MAEKKTSFVLPTDCIEDLEDFTDEIKESAASNQKNSQ